MENGGGGGGGGGGGARRGVGGSITSPVRYSYLSILRDDSSDMFAAFILILILHYSFSALILSVVMTSFYIHSNRFSVKCKGLSYARVVSITKKEYGLPCIFVKIHKILKTNI